MRMFVIGLLSIVAMMPVVASAWEASDSQALLYYRYSFGGVERAESEGHRYELHLSLADAAVTDLQSWARGGAPALGSLHSPNVHNIHINPPANPLLNSPVGSTLWVNGVPLRHSILLAKQQEGADPEAGEEEKGILDYVEEAPKGILIGIVVGGLLLSGCC